MHLHYRGLDDHGFKQHHMNKFITPRTLGLKNTQFSFRGMVQRWTRGVGRGGHQKRALLPLILFEHVVAFVRKFPDAQPFDEIRLICLVWSGAK